MTTLQEQFEKDYPNKDIKKINIDSRYLFSKFTNRDLDVSEYKNLEKAILNLNKIFHLIYCHYWLACDCD